LGAEEPDLQKPAGFINVQVVAKGAVYYLLQIPARGDLVDAVMACFN
jgi:hypothetical protein